MSNSALREAGRRWRDRQKEAFWRVVVSRQRRSGLSVRAFCEGEGLKATKEATSVALSFSHLFDRIKWPCSFINVNVMASSH